MGRWIDIRSHPPTQADCLNGYLLVWHAFQWTMAVKLSDGIENHMYTHWQPVPLEGWIVADDRMPTSEDGDVHHCVLILYDEGQILVSGWHRFARDNFCIAWQHTPPPPENYLEYRDMF